MNIKSGRCSSPTIIASNLIRWYSKCSSFDFSSNLEQRSSQRRHSQPSSKENNLLSTTNASRFESPRFKSWFRWRRLTTIQGLNWFWLELILENIIVPRMPKGFSNFGSPGETYESRSSLKKNSRIARTWNTTESTSTFGWINRSSHIWPNCLLHY